MKNVKRSFAALFALVLVLAAGCGKKDSSKVVDYTVDVPGGFEEAEEPEGVTKAWNNMTDGSSVNVNITEKDANFKDITADALRDALTQYFAESYGEAAVTDKYFNSDEVCGMPAYQYGYTVEVMGREMTQLVVCVDADKTYTVTYTDTTGGWMKEFETSAKNISLVFE